MTIFASKKNRIKGDMADGVKRKTWPGRKPAATPGTALFLHRSAPASLAIRVAVGSAKPRWKIMMRSSIVLALMRGAYTQ